MKVTPTCRYGHGPLQKESPVPAPSGDSPKGTYYWSLLAVKLVTPAKDDPTGQNLASSVPYFVNDTTQRIYSVQLMKCPHCGYLELFDDETLNG